MIKRYRDLEIPERYIDKRGIIKCHDGREVLVRHRSSSHVLNGVLHYPVNCANSFFLFGLEGIDEGEKIRLTYVGLLGMQVEVSFSESRRAYRREPIRHHIIRKNTSVQTE